MRKGMRAMSDITFALSEIIESPQEKLTKAAAKKILRDCGIMDRSNNIQPAYTKILRPKDQEKNGSGKR